MCGKSEGADSKVSAGAPEDEVEVTPEMIEAGLEAFVYVNEDLYSRERAVTEIYRAMLGKSLTLSYNPPLDWL